MISLSSITKTFATLANPVQSALTSIATGFLEEIGKDAYHAIKTKIKVGIILAKTFKDFRESYLSEAEDDSIKLNIFEGFFKDDATKTEFNKIFSGEKYEIDFDVLENVFYQKCCEFGHGQLPDFDFVQGISDVIDGINAVAEKYPEFQTALTQRNLGDFRELLEKRGMEHNPTITKRKYLQQLIEMNNKLRFTGIPDLKEKKDIPIPTVFVMQRVVEEIPLQDYLQWKEQLEQEDEEAILDEIQIRQRMKLLAQRCL